MPWCDLVDVSVENVSTDNPPTRIRLVTKVRNAGRGQALSAKVELLEYGGLASPATGGWDNYIGPLAPQTTAEDLQFQTLDLADTPANDRYRVLLRWKAMFGVHGEAYVEEHYGASSLRPRLKVLLWHNRLWRWITRFNTRGRTPPILFRWL
jgi:hypothetical protein